MWSFLFWLNVFFAVANWFTFVVGGNPNYFLLFLLNAGAAAFMLATRGKS